MDKSSIREVMKTRAGSTIAFVAPLIVLVALAAYLRLTYEPEPVLFELEVPRTVSVAPDQRALALDITLRLANQTDASVDLVAINECNMLRWFLLDDAGSFIQSQLMEQCSDGAVADIIGPNSALVRTTGIPLDAGRLIPGEEYHLMVRFWGYEARETFRVSDESD